MSRLACISYCGAPLLGRLNIYVYYVICLKLFSDQPLSINSPGGGEGYSLCHLNRDVRPDRVWFSGCFVFNGVSISSLSVLKRVSLRDLMV